MTPRGKLIVIEGIDGSGKRTQADLLIRALRPRGIDCVSFSFPRYESSFGHLIARFLNGDFGPLDAVDPHFSAMLYAGDRFESKPELEAALAAGHTVITDRYVASNLAHQTARMPRAQHAEFIAWLRNLEYCIYGLPVEDLVIYLRLSPAEAQRLVRKKGARDYTQRKQDLQEEDLRHLEEAALIYDRLAGEPNWVTVECLDSAIGALKAPEPIHAEVMHAVSARLLPRSLAS